MAGAEITSGAVSKVLTGWAANILGITPLAKEAVSELTDGDNQEAEVVKATSDVLRESTNRIVDFLSENANKVSHIMQEKHAWNRIVELTGDTFKDYQSIQPYLQKAVDLGQVRILNGNAVELSIRGN